MPVIFTSPGSDTVMIDIDTVMHSMVNARDVIITNNVTYVVHGMVNANVMVDEGSKLILHGTIEGHVVNFGNCAIYGTVIGTVSDMESGKTAIDPKAIVKVKTF